MQNFFNVKIKLAYFNVLFDIKSYFHNNFMQITTITYYNLDKYF